MNQWNIKGINLFMDISTYCNAGCPQCHRTNPNGLDKVDWLPLTQWSLGQFIKAFPKTTLRNVARFHFCGTFGDPVMAKDIYQIVEYIINNSYSDIYFDTNGSMRNEDFWWDIGVLGGERLGFKFDVDGITQEMHSYYRRFTDLQKVLDNMDAISNTYAIVHSQTILFKHNQDYKEEIEALCKKHGSTKHTFTPSNRFDQTGPITHHTDENGKSFVLEEMTGELAIEQTPIVPPEFKGISCQWARPRNEIFVSYDGQILPCCYHQNTYHRKFRGLRIGNDDLYNEYEDNKKELNI